VSETTKVPEAPRGWVLYDGQCSFCTGSVNRVRKILMRRGFVPEPLQSPWVNERLKLPESELLTDMRLLLKDGTLLNGADAYLYVMRRIWWTFPLGVIFALPGLKWLFARAYRKFAQNRYCIGGTCQVQLKGHRHK
jgi:predicted DCC family thiol-disulfide oxidoreductase YuxK